MRQRAQVTLWVGREWQDRGMNRDGGEERSGFTPTRFLCSAMQACKSVMSRGWRVHMPPEESGTEDGARKIDNMRDRRACGSGIYGAAGGAQSVRVWRYYATFVA